MQQVSVALRFAKLRRKMAARPALEKSKIAAAGRILRCLSIVFALSPTALLRGAAGREEQR